jgi:aspartate racemase
MKRIGILGGMSPESTIHYYQLIVQSFIQLYGNHGYPEIVIFSVSFEQYIHWQENGDWEAIGKELAKGAQILEKAGADFVVIATNTMHKVVDEIQRAINIPVLNLLDVVAESLLEKGITKTGLLGTRYTMEDGFYAAGLAKHGIDVVVPETKDRDLVHRVIYDELIKGVILPSSKEEFRRIVNDLQQNGAQGVVLGCTEIPMLLGDGDVSIPVFDTTQLHAEAALRFALLK